MELMTKPTKEELFQKLIQNPYQVQKELNNRSLYQFLKWAWPEVSSHPFETNWHLPFLCSVLERAAERVGNRLPKEYDILINISPGTTKTILCSIVFPVWCWTKWHWLRFITASYSSQLSLESAEYSRDLILSNRFQKVYPELTIKSDKNTKGNFKITKRIPNGDGGFKVILGGNRYSTSVGGTLTGFHGDIIIWDDPLNPMQALSDKEVETANRWIDRTLPTRKTSKKNSFILGIMQRLEEDDPTGHILKKKKQNIKHFSLPAEIRTFKKFLKPASLERFYKNDLFDANRMPWSVLKEMETDLGEYGYAGQFGQAPAPASGGMFKVEHLQLMTEIILKPKILKIVRYWDKAGSSGKGAYTAGVKMLLLKNGFFVVEDVKRGQWGSHQRERIIKQTAIADGPEVEVWIEQEPGSGGKESAEGTVRNLAGFIVKVEKPTGKKELRADPYSVQVNSGNVYMRVADWNGEYKRELALFPNGRFKDQVDASSGAFNALVQKKVVQRIT